MTEHSPATLPATPAYPPATRLDLVEDLHGRRVADPYRWLEDPAAPETERWSAAQDELTASWLGALPGREALAARLAELSRTGSVGAPVWRAGRAFFTRRDPDQDHAVLRVREPDGSERVLLDPVALDPTGATTLDGWSPSREGTRLAYQVSVGGDEHSLLHVLDVDSGELVEGPIDRCRYSPVGWLPGGEEFFYVRQLAPELVPEDERLFHRRVWRHRVGADPSTDANVHGDELDHTYYYGLSVSADGRWLVVSGAAGTVQHNSVWIADLAASDSPAGGGLRPVITADAGARTGASVARDGRLYLTTSLGAPRFRLCVTDPADPGAPEDWTELVPEQQDSVLEGSGLVAGSLVLLRTRHAVSELHLHDASGAHVREIPTPGTGSVHGWTTTDALTDPDDDRLWFGWTDFATPVSVHRFSISTGETVLDTPNPGSVRLPDVTTRQVEFTSPDGTTVRMFLVAGSAEPDLPRPALLTGYGGFAVGRGPGYTSTALAWAEAGGVWAHVSLRGGDEEGEEWHRAGRRERKQNVFDDFHAAAEHLVGQGWTTPQQLAIMGGSNGGLLVGAALTQRPELYAAVVCSAPLLDMVRYERFLLGRLWAEEYGSAAVPEELGWLLSYSPYHRVAPGVEYPSVLFTVFESDSRVDPNHARKMCAALQAATASDPVKHPVLIRRETEVGHAGRSVSRSVALAADQVSFLAWATGLEL
ncbi:MULTISPECIES: prolyl oligopeptidase family serine peptidase [Actinosynnema]|uniref:prolyl oligopeptidase family serine peptidase n=1 Tax=Actinosynnema TaxID=40566 RepID=UPI0020A39D9F|nr:prolyl oligopeptidase family serine peptidase [Actinosynnema pretiosum]MCP2092917.1 prolyl oligopeptidase [Actinosynnema pretiosum]